jgi:uncharacterized protein (DUF983 family)
MNSEQKGDARAAFTGFIVGAIVLFAIMFAIVKWTNARFDRHETAAPAAQH